MRPEGKGLPALEKALAEATDLHAEAVAIVERGCATTVEQLARAEARDREMLAMLTNTIAELMDLDADIRAIEATLAPLYRRRADLATDNENQAATVTANQGMIEELRALIKTERATNGPLEERRRKEVERLERRIALKRARGPGLPALFIGG